MSTRDPAILPALRDARQSPTMRRPSGLRRARKRLAERLGVTERHAFDYKDPASLAPFLTEGGKIIPARLSGLSRRMQRRLALAVKRARMLALLPFVVRD